MSINIERGVFLNKSDNGVLSVSGDWLNDQLFPK